MPRKQEAISKASLTPDDTPERFRLGDLGYAAPKVINGVSVEEIKRELNHPNSIQTYKLMTYHPAITAPLALYDAMISKATYRVLPPKDATEAEKKQTEIVASMLDDMEHDFDDFIQAAMTKTIYGFAVIEKVYRKRYKSNGSAYNDGIIAPKKLKLIPQETVAKFIFDDQGNELVGCKQDITGTIDPYGRYDKRKDNTVVLPRNKFMLFQCGKNRNNPYGTSPLKQAYLPWKYLQALEELEAQGVARDFTGVPLLYLPAAYLSADASPEQKAALENFKNILRNLQAGTQSSVILPQLIDSETRQQLFKLELLSTDGKRSFDINKIKEYYRTMLFIAMGADILLLGNSSSGSFALGSIKNSLTGSVIEAMLKEIVNTVNNDLIKQIYELNNWSVDRRCKFDYEGMQEESLDEVGKFVQRCSAVNMLTKDLDTVNYVRNAIGLDRLPEGTDIDALLPDNSTKSGEGMKQGLNSGTGTAVGGGDTSATNLNNAA